MLTRIARGLAGTAVVVALAASAACGSEGGGTTDDPTERPNAAEAAETSSAASDSDESIGSLFPGKGAGGQSAPIDVPTTKVGESAGGKVKVVNASDQPMNFSNPQTSTDNPDMGDAAADLGTCTGTLAPGEECELDFRFMPYETGSYSGVLTVETSQGETITVPFSGEAVADEPSPTTETPEPSPTTETPEPTPTTETPDPTPTSEPTPIETEPEIEPESDVT
ncbi:Ig-like domain-containing protein [Streptomyces gardneri]|uniref:Ig-like domain-containing protein n=1 Tax=Streptomyces gardneri TaxID=66892 RepID=UPI0035D58A29